MATFLTILKIIGFVLLAVLALVLLVLLLVLFVPVRYRGQASYHDKVIRADLSAGWLFRLIRYDLKYDKELETGLYLFGRKQNSAPVDGPDEEYEREKEAWEKEMNGEEPELPDAGADLPAGEEPQAPETSPETGAQEVPAAQDAGLPAEEAPEKEKKSLLGRIRLFGIRLEQKKRDAFFKLKKVIEFLQDDRNIVLADLLIRSLRRLLVHILPRKAEGELNIGYEDPQKTGQVLTWIAVLYPVWHEGFRITPYFDEEVLDGEIRMRGRIMLGYVGLVAARVWFDKNFRRAYKFIRSL